MSHKRFQVSKDSPAYYLTSVAKNRLPIFRTETIARLACEAINEARTSGKFLIFAYVVMPDHSHLVTDSSRESKDVHRYINGIVSRRIIDHLKQNGYEESLQKLMVKERTDGWKYSLWQHHPDTRFLWSDQMLWQRIQYTHLNPVRAGLADRPNDWKWSSARIVHGKRSDNEPLEVDIDRIQWRK
jgi:REP element-mobilizing transposase RayT